MISDLAAREHSMRADKEEPVKTSWPSSSADEALVPDHAGWARQDRLKTGSAAAFMLQHLVAGAVSFVLFVGGSIALLIWAMIIDNDPGGPMFFPVFVLLVLLAAACACVVLFCLTAGLQLLRRWLRFPWWVPLVAIFPLTFATLAFPGTTGSVRSGLWLLAASAIVTIAFGMYWAALQAAGGLLDRIRRARATQHEDRSQSVDMAR